jgi:5'-3' exonuclease
VQLHRRARKIIDEAGVVEKFGVRPASIPDYLALVGDAADGFPGIPGWGAKSTSAVLARYEHLETIPRDARAWDIRVAAASKLAESLRRDHDRAFLFRTLATLRTDVPLFEDVETLRWNV